MVDMISVIVPVYNVSDELPRCLDSILEQTYPHIEIIAVDDGSPDNSGEILNRYAQEHPSIRVIHKENGGVTSARLRGVAEASGDWIGFVDGDDEIEPDMYARLLNNAIMHNADISHCGYQICFDDGRVHYFHNTGTMEVHNRKQAIQELLSGQRIEPGLCNKLFAKSLFQDLKMDTSIKINEDLLMNYYLFASAESAVYEDWCPYHYIVRATSASRAKMNDHKIYDPIRVKEIIRKSADGELYEDAQRAYINTCINTYHALLLAGKELDEDRHKVRNLLKGEQAHFTMLGKKRSLMAQLIVAVPWIYRPIYWLYSRFFQKNIYT